MFKKQRRLIASCFPDPLRLKAQRMARVMDKISGYPTSHMRKGSVVMFHVGRCGSTVLGRMLDHHPDVYWDGECFYNEFMASPQSIVGVKTTEWLQSNMLMAGRKYYGFEFKPLPDQHLFFVGKSLDEFLTDVYTANVEHFILLQRRNSLRRMVSQQVGAKTGVRHISNSTGAVLRKINLSVGASSFGDNYVPKKLLTCLEDIDNVFSFLEQRLTARNPLKLTYEDDIDRSGPSVAYAKVCAYLGIPPVEIFPDLEKTNPFPLKDIIENFEEVSNELAGTKFEWMLSG